ncbi:MAG TPA: hypothetical protein VFP10_12670 [Candidatus Eisenbacteria bacterium]|nr:hypothetical protein [Candidatus Eisenbacteria bacterium]
MGPEDLQDLAQEFLDACVEALDTIPVSAPGLGGAPERSYITHALPAFDCCPQLTVHVASVTPSPTSPGTAIGTSARSALVTVVGLVATILRCVQAGENIPTATMTAEAAQINADGWALWNEILNAIRAGTLFQQCGEVFWDGLRPSPAQGGCAGWTLNLRVLLDGYP